MWWNVGQGDVVRNCHVRPPHADIGRWGSWSAPRICFGLEGLDVLEPVDDPAAEFDEFRAFARPPPTLQRAVRDVPASRQLDLGKVPERHVNLLVDLREHLRDHHGGGAWEGTVEGNREGNWEAGEERCLKTKKAAPKERPFPFIAMH